MTFSLRALALLSLSIPAQCLHQAMTPRPADTYADPANDPYNLLRYISSDAVVGAAHGLTLLVALLQLNLAYRYRTWWLLILPISILFFSEGLAIRFVLSRERESRSAFIAQSSLVLLSPCGFIAADSILLRRLARYLGAERHLPVMPYHITNIFVLSEVTGFLVQATGLCLSVSSTAATRDLGRHLLFSGLLLQFISFVLFSAMLALWVFRVRVHEPHVWRQHNGRKWSNDWRALTGALAVSCAGIIVRCVYRVAEGSQGPLGPLAMRQWAFYAFDVIPLFVSVAVFVPFWPGRFIPRVVTRTTHTGEPPKMAPNHELNILSCYT